MIDKILKISDTELVIYFSDSGCPPFRLYHSGGKVSELAAWFFSPTTLTLSEHERATVTGEEPTCLTILKAA